MRKSILLSVLLVGILIVQFSILMQVHSLNYNCNNILHDDTENLQFEQFRVLSEDQKPELPESSSYAQPITRENMSIVPLDEILFFGTDEWDSDDLNGWLWNDAIEGYGQLAHWDDDDNLKKPDVAPGDVDGDGKDEIILVRTDGSNFIIKIYDDGRASVPYKKLKQWSTDMDDCDNPHVAVGDVNGDGDDEFIVAGTDADDCDLNAFLWDYHPETNTVTKLKEWDDNDNIAEVDVAMGDSDYDGCAEIMFVGVYDPTIGTDRTLYKLYEDASKNYVLNKTENLSTLYLPPSVASGDIDGDLKDEFIISRPDNEDLAGYCGADIYIIDKTTNYVRINIDPLYWTYLRGIVSISTGDIDGDSVDEIIIAGDTYIEPSMHARVIFYEYQYPTLVEISTWVPSDQESMYMKCATGDIDCDGIDEVVVCGVDADGEDINGYAFDNITGDFNVINQWDHNDGTNNVVVTCGNFDGDGIRIQYTGESWLSQSRPIPVVAMACAPLIRGISQNYVLSGTTFGVTDSFGTQNSKQVAASSSVTLSYEGEFPLIGLKSSISATLSSEFSKTKTSSSYIKYGTYFSNGYPDDSLIYQIVTYKHYLYIILNHTDESQIGKHITIDVPMGATLNIMTLSYFNTVFLGYGIDVDPFHHFPGDVRTYPTVAEKTLLVAQYNGFTSSLYTVGQGNGITTAFIDISEETMTSEQESTGFSLEEGASIAGIGFSGSFGLTESEMYSVSTGTEVYYAGTVGHIADEDDYKTYNYSYGMFVYNYKPNPNLAYQVINYWVENASPIAPPFFGNLGMAGTMGLIISFGSLAGLSFLMYKKRWFVKETRDAENLEDNDSEKSNVDSEETLEKKTTKKTKTKQAAKTAKIKSASTDTSNEISDIETVKDTKKAKKNIFKKSKVLTDK